MFMVRCIASALLALAWALPAGGQAIPTRPQEIPGATKLRTIPKTPKQALRRAQQAARSSQSGGEQPADQDAEVRDLMQQALETDDPYEQARLYQKILLIDPNNAVAYSGRKDALEAIEGIEAAEHQQRQEESEQIDDALGRELIRRDAVQKTEDALLMDDIESARREIDRALEVAPADPDVQRLDQLIADRERSARRTRYLLIGVGAVALIGLAVFLFFWIRNRDPYVEVIAGRQKGQRFPFDALLLKIGAVADDGGEKNDVVLPDVERMISRFHCEIHRRGNTFYLIDVGSANGTFLDRKQITPGKPFRLRRGSRVDLAHTCAIRLGFERRRK